MRLIDADDLKKELIDVYSHLSERYNISPVLRLVIDAPTVDAVEVVRCKDCKNFIRTQTLKNYPVGICREWNEISYLDGYCSYGRRREDENSK